MIKSIDEKSSTGMDYFQIILEKNQVPAIVEKLKKAGDHVVGTTQDEFIKR